MRNLKILAYHNIDSNLKKDPLAVKPEDLEKQILFFLKKGWHCLTLKDLYNQYLFSKKRIDKKIFIITLDDGYKNIYSNVFPILKKHNLKATVFLVLNFIGKNNFLNWQEILEMQDLGVEFGSHTLSHRKLTKISLAEAEKEISDSKKILEQKLGGEITSFCYPISDFNEDILKLVKEAGYRLAVVTPCRSGIKESNFTLKRIGLSSKDNNLRFRFKASRFFYSARMVKFSYRDFNLLKSRQPPIYGWEAGPDGHKEEIRPSPFDKKGCPKGDSARAKRVPIWKLFRKK